MIDHISLQVSDVAASQAFYEVVLAPLGIACGHSDGTVAGFFGPEPGSFWLSPAQREQDRELHIAFRATDRDQVVLVVLGEDPGSVQDLGAQPERGRVEGMDFGAFIRDPDGHNIEAVCSVPPG